MKINFKNLLRVIKINLILIFLILFFFEIFFGFWFKKDNFGIYIRENRNKNEIYKISKNKNIKIINYKREYYGFREEKNINPEKVKIVFLGGSTGNERFKNYQDTIVGNINKINKEFKIYNASTDGKTLRGYSYDLKNWFPKINKLKIKYIIAYTGINDSQKKFPEKHDLNFSNRKIFQLRDYITNNSIIVYLSKKIIWRIKAKKNDYDLKYDFNWEDKYKKFDYINYEKALKIHNKVKLIQEHSSLVNKINQRLVSFYELAKKNKIEIIFITQVYYDGLRQPEIFVTNEIIKKFCKKNSIKIIKLDEIVQMEKNDFYDGTHTTEKGSFKIAKILAPKIKKMIEIKD